MKEKAKRLSQTIMKGRIPLENDTKKPLEAIIDNMNVAVRLEGNDLHGNGNNPYFPSTRFPLEADIGDGRHVRVNIVPDSIHDSISGLVKQNGLGYFKIFTEQDYEPDDTIQFVSKNWAIIDIGRYGPFLKTGKSKVGVRLWKDIKHNWN